MVKKAFPLPERKWNASADLEKTPRRTEIKKGKEKERTTLPEKRSILLNQNRNVERGGESFSSLYKEKKEKHDLRSNGVRTPREKKEEHIFLKRKRRGGE